MKKPKINQEDIDLFRSNIKGVKPIKPTDRLTTEASKPKPKKIQQPEFTDNKTLTDDHTLASVTGDESIHFSKPGVQAREIKRLKRGQFPCEQYLDLHGKTIDEAEQLILQFIDHCTEAGMRCVRIVHGKGYSTTGQAPKIKNKVNQWLRHHPSIIAFCSAQPKDGGAGAVYVLLKRST